MIKIKTWGGNVGAIFNTGDLVEMDGILYTLTRVCSGTSMTILSAFEMLALRWGKITNLTVSAAFVIWVLYRVSVVGWEIYNVLSR